MMGWDIPGRIAPKRMKQEEQEFKTNWGSLVRMTDTHGVAHAQCSTHMA